MDNRRIHQVRHQKASWFYNEKGNRYIYFTWKGKEKRWDKWRGQDLAINTVIIIIVILTTLLANWAISLPD